MGNILDGILILTETAIWAEIHKKADSGATKRKAARKIKRLERKAELLTKKMRAVKNG